VQQENSWGSPRAGFAIKDPIAIYGDVFVADHF
jgi:hypothetical protein